jgi:outer membrane protein assembly factor BamB
MRYVLSLFVLSLNALLLSAGENWPQFRGPDGNGISDARTVPTTWSETENIRWKTAIHDKGWSSPVIWGNQIWLTTTHEVFDDPKPKENTGKREPRPQVAEFYAVCVDRTSGTILHDVKVFVQKNPAFCIDYNSYATPTPVVEAGRVYVHFGSHGTACLDTDSGKVLWNRRDLSCDHWRGPGSSPILYKDLLILTFDGYDQQYMAALDKKTGETVWKKDRKIKFPDANGDLRKAYSTPSIMMFNGKPQLISPAAEATIAYNPENGDELWRIHLGGMNEASRPVFGNGLIYLNNGHRQTMFAIKQGGSGMLSEDSIAWKTNKGVPSRPSMLLLGNYIYMVADSAVASCVDAKTGTQLWSERLGGSFCASPVAANGNIYFCDQETPGKTHVMAVGPNAKVVAVNKLDDGCMASPAIAGDAIFLRTKKNLYCIGSKK